METPEEQHVTVPVQPGTDSRAKLMKYGVPVTLALIATLVVAEVSKINTVKPPQKSVLSSTPTTIAPPQVSSYDSQQAQQVHQDQQSEQRAALMKQLHEQDAATMLSPEVRPNMPLTDAQSRAMYTNNPNAPQQTSGASEAQAQARQRALDREKARQDALNSDTLVVDFSKQEVAPTSTKEVATSAGPDIAPTGISEVKPEMTPEEKDKPEVTPAEKKDKTLSDPQDVYTGKLYRIFEGTLIEGTVTNHIDGGMKSPIIVEVTADVYSHDHLQLLIPRGTRLIGEVGQVGDQQQHRLAVVFHRAIPPNGFPIELDKYIGLDPLGTTGLATKVDHGYLPMFAAAAAVGALGGVAQIGNTGSSVLTTGGQLQEGFSSQTSQEGEQILAHFLNRLPIITLKEGSRARVYISRDLYVPAYSNEQPDPHQ